MMISDWLQKIRPSLMLDIGCGCGHTSSKYTPYCERVILSDLSPAFTKRAYQSIGPAKAMAVCMDGRKLALADSSIDAVIESCSFHHMENWPIAINEMYRVASKYILIEEPINDIRNQPKRDAIKAWQLYLDVQMETGHSHYPHIKPDILLGKVRQMGLPIEYEISKSDELILFDDFFGEFGRFAEQSKRPRYWYDRLAEFRNEISARPLCESDIISIIIHK